MSRDKIVALFHKLPMVVVAALLSLLIEVLVFQYPFWSGLFQKQEMLDFEIVAGGELTEEGDIYVVSKPLQLSVSDLEAKRSCPKNVLIDFSRYTGEEQELQAYTTMQLYATDEGNHNLYALSPFRNLLPTEEKSQFFGLHTYGTCKSLRVDIYAEEQDLIKIERFVLNPHRSFAFSWLRFVLMYFTLLFLYYAFIEKSFLKEKLSAPSNFQRRVCAVVLVAQICLFLGAVSLNKEFRTVPWPHHKQYHELAVALSKGQLFLEELPPASLNELQNPYDMVDRRYASERTGDEYRWDTAYYNQKYYVYFGVVPVLVFYLPWYLITKTEFPTWLGIAFVGVFFIFGVFRLTRNIAKKYFENDISFGIWLLSTLLMVNGCGVLTIMRRPDFYSLPILMAVVFSVWGIDLWISSLEKDEVTAWKLVAGCLLMALVAGCRPQLAVASFLIFPIYWDAVFKKRLLFSKKGIVPTSLSVASYGCIAAGLMVYNWRRFGSFFDFGANYNLTTNDMTKRGFELARIPVGIFRFLLQPPSISAKFPFLEQTPGWSGYVGQNITESLFGGFLPVSLLVMAGIFVVFCKRKWFEKKKIWVISAMSMLFGLLIVCVDVQGAGIVLRYMSDFGWLFYLGTIFAWFMTWRQKQNGKDTVAVLWTVTGIAFMLSMAFWFLLLFTDGQFMLESTDPKLFYKIYYQLAFWA